MSTIIRPVIAANKPYYISKHRYYELKHHCLQYKEWKEKILEKNFLKNKNNFKNFFIYNNFYSEVENIAIQNAGLKSQMELIEKCCEEAGGDIANYIFISVTEGKSYATLNPPCGKEYFYNRYRYFFWMLDKELSQ